MQVANGKARKKGARKDSLFAINLQDKISLRRAADKFHNYSRRLECRLSPSSLYVEFDNFIRPSFSIFFNLRQAPDLSVAWGFVEKLKKESKIISLSFFFAL